jgi:hypothetical protein
VDAFREDTTLEHAARVYKTFVAPHAKLQVNLSHDTLQTIQATLQEYGVDLAAPPSQSSSSSVGLNTAPGAVRRTPKAGSPGAIAEVKSAASSSTPMHSSARVQTVEAGDKAKGSPALVSVPGLAPPSPVAASKPSFSAVFDIAQKEGASRLSLALPPSSSSPT